MHNGNLGWSPQLRDGITEGYHKYKEKTPPGVANMEEMVFNYYL
jgi:hypothetical protein